MDIRQKGRLFRIPAASELRQQNPALLIEVARLQWPRQGAELERPRDRRLDDRPQGRMQLSQHGWITVAICSRKRVDLNGFAAIGVRSWRTADFGWRRLSGQGKRPCQGLPPG